MRVVTSRTVVFLFEARFLCAAGSVMIPCPRVFRACHGVIIETTEPFSTFPTPRSATSGTYNESAPCLQTACKDIVAGIIFEAPT
jgi:hypothetical protein